MRIRIFIWCSSGCGFGYLFDVVPDTDPDFYLCWCKFECGFKLPKQCGSGSTTRLLLENFFIIWKLMRIVSGSSLLLWYSSGYRSVFFYFMRIRIRMQIQDPKQCGSIQIRMRIRVTKTMRIHPDPDPDPQHDFSWRTFIIWKFMQIRSRIQLISLI
jgi:hypothetical protein